MDIISVDIPTFGIIEYQCDEKAYLHHGIYTCEPHYLNAMFYYDVIAIQT